jgi:hypothetical protein
MPDCRTTASPSLVAIGLMLAAAGCARQAPTAPAPAGLTAGTSLEASTSSPSFPLLDGTFTLTTATGTMSGTYTGTEARKGQTDASVGVNVTGGTGSFDGATATLRGDGVGTFAGEGSFTLALKGRVAAVASQFNLRITLAGTTSLSCDAGRVIATQTSTGTGDGLGAVTASFRHQVGNAGCSD